MRSAQGQSENRAQSAGTASVAHFEKRLVMYRNPRVALALTSVRVVLGVSSECCGLYRLEPRLVLTPQLEVTTGRMHTR